MPILGGCPGPDSGGRDDGERQAAQAPAAVRRRGSGRCSSRSARSSCSQADAARKWGVDVLIVIRFRRLAKDAALAAFAAAKPGRLPSPEQASWRPRGGERSALGGDQGAGDRVGLHRGRQRSGFSARSRARLSAQTKLELMGLIDGAVSAGWAHARACRVLEIADVRVYRWRARLAETGSFDDLPPVGNRVHRILDWEE